MRRPILTAILFAGSFTLSAATFDELIQQGRTAFLAADPARAESAYNQACPADIVSDYPVAKAVTCDNALASVDESRGILSRAEQRYVHAVNAAEQAGPAYRPLYSAKLIDLGEFYHHHGRFTEAEACLLKGVDLARTLTSTTPQLLPEALIRLGGFYSDTPKPEQGRAPIVEALGNQAGLPKREVAQAHNALGMIELAAGHQLAAEAHLREAITAATDEFGEDHPITAAYQTNLAMGLLAWGEIGRGGILLRRAKFVVESRRQPSTRELSTIYTGLSAVATAEGKLVLAEEYAHRAISTLGALPTPDFRALAMAQIALGGVYLRAHDTAGAEKLLPSAVESQRQAGTNPNTLATSLQLLGELRAQQQNWQAAESLYREAIGIYDTQTFGTARPLAVRLLRALAEVLKKDGGSKAEVRALESRAREMARSASQNTPRA